MRILIKDIQLVNEGVIRRASVLAEDEYIKAILPVGAQVDADVVIREKDCYLFPGVIDDQVHFREPGLTQKADIHSESRAAVAGGVTSFMDMPNTVPNTTTVDELEKKYERAAQTSLANYSFYIGATNDNLAEVVSVDYSQVCGIKVFMGSSTGNMLVDNETALAALFEAHPALIATHCEDEQTIQRNLAEAKAKYADSANIPWRLHSQIRSAEACFLSSQKAATLARKYGARLHILHLSTAQEVGLLDTGSIAERKITGEACVHYLLFSDADYDTLGERIKWNPAIKTAADRDALRKAVAEGVIPVVATDHAPHTREEKFGKNFFSTPSGGPMVQHSLVAMLDLAAEGYWSYETVAQRMAHAPAELFKINRRGYIREGYYADLVMVRKRDFVVTDDNVFYKCGWSPLNGRTLHHQVVRTFVNGRIAFENGYVNDDVRGKRLTFSR
ncbi:MAG: dihydroorotase [Marinilabiliaceae bacterium]|nr:dihydroorotase [Marinilabiliaceae bacterium]